MSEDTTQYLSVEEALAKAPSDLQEKDVEVWGGKVRVRALTAAQSSRVKQVGISLRGQGADLAWAEMEKLQFQLGVIQPKFTKDQVEKLHRTSGAGFAEVISALDEITGIRKEDLRAAQDDFPEPEVADEA